MNLLVIAGSSFIIALSGALMPGPLLTITVGESMKRGAITGPLVIFGHALLELIVVLLVLAGIAPLLRSDSVRSVVSVVGGAALILMGVLTLRDARRARLDLTDGPAGRSLNPVLAGIVASASNPYWVMWWTTIGLGYLVSAMRLGVIGVAAFFVGHVAADLAWYSMVAYAVSRGKAFIGQRGYRFILVVCGLFLLLFGAWFMRVA